MTADPMSLTQDLAFVGMVGMIDPLRAEAKDAVAIALGAGIDVRMITGDNPITAGAIGEELGLGPGAISGTELPGAVRRGGRRAGCPSCTSSAASRRRTSCASRG